MAESDTWEGRENLKNAKEVIEEFKKEYQRDMECYKLHLVISPPILRRFPQSQSQLKALKKTFRSMPVMSQSNQ